MIIEILHHDRYLSTNDFRKNCFLLIFWFREGFNLYLLSIRNHRDGAVAVSSEYPRANLFVPFHDLRVRKVADVSFPDTQDGIGRLYPFEEGRAAR